MTNIDYTGNECPCGSSKDIRACCLQPDNTLHKMYHSVVPPGGGTGYSHPNCYLGHTIDCSTKISAEHYISRSVLNAIRKGEKLIRLSGAAWIPKGSERLLPPEALASKILCRRHNSLLHPLDSAALAMMRAFVKTFDADLVSGENALTLTSGQAFEAWAIKTAIGCVHSDIFADSDGKSVKAYALDPRALLPALRGEPLPPGCGIYMQVAVGSETPGYPPFRIAPFLKLQFGQRHVVGADFAVFGCDFRVIFDPEGVPDNLEAEGWGYRPGIIQFQRPDFCSALLLSWSDSLPHGQVNFLLSPRPRASETSAL